MAQPPDPIVSAQDRFIAAWGQMGGAWGISRTMAEVFALLYITGEAMNTDGVMDRLAISRGNASMSLRALQDWGIVGRVHKRGDRKEYFEAERDVWAIFKTIVRERKKRELDPVLAALYEIRDMTGVERGGAGAAGAAAAAAAAAAAGEGARAAHNRRLDALLEFMSAMERLADAATSQETTIVRDMLSALEASEGEGP